MCISQENRNLAIKIPTMKVINLGATHSVINQYMAELRNVDVQGDRMRFRHNLHRIGQCMAYEVSKTLDYSDKTITTPLAQKQVPTFDDNIVIGTVLRAGLAMHQGFLDVFDKADCAFVSAYRDESDTAETLDIHVEYIACPSLEGRTFMLVDPMLATGGSLELSYQAFLRKGTPAKLHICVAIASQQGIDFLQQHFPSDEVTLWCAGIDPELNERAYIVPGLGDAGDLCFGEKMSGRAWE